AAAAQTGGNGGSGVAIFRYQPTATASTGALTIAATGHLRVRDDFDLPASAGGLTLSNSGTITFDRSIAAGDGEGDSSLGTSGTHAFGNVTIATGTTVALTSDVTLS